MIKKEYDYIRNSWLSYTNIVGRKIQVSDEKNVITGTVSKVDDTGCLILDTKKGNVRVVTGDVKYL